MTTIMVELNARTTTDGMAQAARLFACHCSAAKRTACQCSAVKHKLQVSQGVSRVLLACLHVSLTIWQISHVPVDGPA